MSASRLSSAVSQIFKQARLVIVTMLVFAVAVLLLPILVPYGVALWLRGKWLVRRFREEFGRKGRYAILVYSESPNWQDYFEEHVITPAGGHAVVLNWSERRLWKKSRSLPISVFLHFKPATEFNPYALVFLPKGRLREIAFFSAFRDHKHGRTRRLEQSVAELMAHLRVADEAWAKEPKPVSSAA